MPEAALEITQDRVESFVETYLEAIGATLEKHDTDWVVDLPTTDGTPFAEQTLTLELGTQLSSDKADGDYRLSPQSDLFHQLVTSAIGAHPAGSGVLNRTTVDATPPEWLIPEDNSVTADYYPLYDRDASCIWFRASVETVSEYQTELLQTIAIDHQTHTAIPNLARALLDHTDSIVKRESSSTETLTVDSGVLSAARDAVEEELQPNVERIQESASKSAANEISRYQELKEQERTEYQERLSRITEELSAISSEVETAPDQEHRVEALNKREELKQEQQELEAELESIRTEIRTGFVDYREEVMDRHAVRVSITPVAVTQITYERGELELQHETKDRNVLTVGYAPGVGLLDSVRCAQCGTPIAETNHVHRLLDDELVGDCCSL